MTDSMWALARASRCPRQRFQAWKAPLRCVCFRSRRATVCSSRAVLYLLQAQHVSRAVHGGERHAVLWTAALPAQARATCACFVNDLQSRQLGAEAAGHIPAAGLPCAAAGVSRTAWKCRRCHRLHACDTMSLKRGCASPAQPSQSCDVMQDQSFQSPFAGA